MKQYKKTVQYLTEWLQFDQLCSTLIYCYCRCTCIQSAQLLSEFTALYRKMPVLCCLMLIDILGYSSRTSLMDVQISIFDFVTEWALAGIQWIFWILLIQYNLGFQFWLCCWMSIEFKEHSDHIYMVLASSPTSVWLPWGLVQ